MGNQLGFLHDTNSCCGLQTCEIACKDFNLSVPRPRFVREIHGGSWIPDASTLLRPGARLISYNLSMSCGHCENPACVANCPTGAMQKDDDTGIRSDMCIDAAPALNPALTTRRSSDDDRAQMQSLSRPARRRDAGLRGCVSMRALEVGSTMTSLRNTAMRQRHCRLKAHPHIVIAPHRSLDENAPEGYSITLYREG